jgi:peroxiredoxin
MPPLQEGDKVPTDIRVQVEDDRGHPRKVKMGDLISNKKVILVGVPGAFTPVCSSSHIPGYVKHLNDFKDKGIDMIGILDANDIYVDMAWKKQVGIEGDINKDVKMIADGNVEFSKAIGMTVDMSTRIMGCRTRRFASYLDNGEVKVVLAEMDEAGGADTDQDTDAEHMLKRMDELKQ